MQKTVRWQPVVPFLLMLPVAALLLVPILWVISASFQTSGQIIQNPFRWIPDTWSLQNYGDAWNGVAADAIAPLSDPFKSSLIVVAIAVPLHVLFNTYIGYVLAKYRFPLKKVLLFLILITMMIPQAITLFPNYLTIKNLSLIDTQAGIALPFLVSGFGVFLMMQFARSVPDEYLEAARMDGATDAWIFVRIAAPLMKPAIATLSILMFTYMWNEYTWSHLIVNSTSVMTMPVVLANDGLNSTGNASYIPIMLAGTVLSFLPILAIFLIFQRQFIESVSQSGIKG